VTVSRARVKGFRGIRVIYSKASKLSKDVPSNNHTRQHTLPKLYEPKPLETLENLESQRRENIDAEKTTIEKVEIFVKEHVEVGILLVAQTFNLPHDNVLKIIAESPNLALGKTQQTVSWVNK
jgi:hypothetical protein